MTVRLIDWRDLPVLRRYRNQCLFFDNVLVLTRGPVLDWVKTLIASVAPSTGVFTFLATADGRSGPPVLGQAAFSPGATAARLVCLAPGNALDFDELEALLDFIVASLGERGAFHILAEADECEQGCDALHARGFAIYARQRMWQLRNDPDGAPSGPADVSGQWRASTDQDTINVRALYNNLTPGLVQQIEPPAVHRPRGMVYYQGQDLLAYVDLKYGPNGIWAQPFIHPDFNDVSTRLAGLLRNLSNRRQRPVYLCIRSYQSWLEAAIEALGAQPGPSQAVMVKRLALARRVLQPAALPALEGTQTEPTVSIAPIRRTWFGKK